MDCTLHIHTDSFSKHAIQNFKMIEFKTLKWLMLGCSAVVFSGCSTLGSGSLAKQSEKLSTGIQKAYSVDAITANRVSPLIIQSAKQNNVDPLLVAAVIRQESSYRNYAVSHAGAVGLTQIIPRYWQQSCPGDLFEEHININCGSYILAQYNQSAGSWPKALAYYNVGPTGYHTNPNMKKQGKRYADQVKQHHHDLKSKL